MGPLEDYKNPIMTGLGILPRLNVPKARWRIGSQWVTTYTVALSVDGLSWEDLGITFTGNDDRDTKVVGAFSTRREARYVRILPQSWNEWLSMRAGVLLCEARRPHRLFGNKHI